MTMEKKIGRLLRILKWEYVLAWVVCLGVVALYETDVLPQGTLVDDGKTGYMLQVFGILLAVALIPLTLKYFALILKRNVLTLDVERALIGYRRLNEIRLSLLMVPALINLTAYYATLSSSGLLCAGMVALAACFCVPGSGRLTAELELPDLSADKTDE